MGRAILYIFVIAAIGYLLAMYALYQKSAEQERIPQDTASPRPRTPPAPASGTFTETGTLIFYPNNAGHPVPYLFYQDERGATAAKALAFPDSPPAGFSSWVGARISVTGRLQREHVLVENLSYIAAP